MDPTAPRSNDEHTPAVGAVARLMLICAFAGVSFVAVAHDEREVRSERREVREDRRERDERRATREERAIKEARDASRALERERKDALERERKDVLEGKSGYGTSGSNTSGSNSGSSSADDHDDADRDDDEHAGGATTRIEVERDAVGRERRGSEVLMIGRSESIAAARTAGFAVISERPMASMGETLARIRVRPGTSVEQSILELQALAPEASVAPHHLFRPSQGESQAAASVVSVHDAHEPATTIGIVDTGASAASPLLAAAVLRTQAFTDGGYRPRSHGTIVASIAASGGAQIAIADVFGVDTENRLIASAAAIAEAIDWLVTDRVRVINISIEGPDNLVLLRVIRRAVASNVAIVAAAGNGGPAAVPPFPAAYPGVIAVTAVDERGEVYRRANRGDYIAFAARGVHVQGLTVADAKPASLSGTSFASPVVSAAIARHLAHDAPVLSDALAKLRSEALDLGPPGRDRIFGWGEIKLLDPPIVAATKGSAQ